MLPKITKTFFPALILSMLSCQSSADILWTYGTDIDQTPHFLRFNLINETSSDDEEIQGYEMDWRYGINDNLGLVARYSYGEGDSQDDGQTIKSILKIADIGLTYGMAYERLFYELKAVYNFRQISETLNDTTVKASTNSARLTPRLRYDLNDYIQTRALVELEKSEDADLGSEAAIYLTLIPVQALALDIKFGKGLTTTDHDDPDQGKWSNDPWYFEPRLSYRITPTFSLEASYRDKKEGGRLIDFGLISIF